MPQNFKEWLGENEKRIATAKSLPYFMRDNVKYTGILTPIAQDIKNSIELITKPANKITYVSFDPFSPIVAEKMRVLRDAKQKLKLFREIINDERGIELNTSERAKTVMFAGHKGRQHETWKGTKQMAADLNNLGESVAFLPELGNNTSTDSLVLFRGKPVLADFKYCTTTNINTLTKDLEYGFTQASTIVLKNTNMDAGTFKGAIDYLVRNDIPYGNIKLLNQYGKQLEISYRDISKGKVARKIKGFL